MRDFFIILVAILFSISVGLIIIKNLKHDLKTVQTNDYSQQNTFKIINSTKTTKKNINNNVDIINNVDTNIDNFTQQCKPGNLNQNQTSGNIIINDIDTNVDNSMDNIDNFTQYETNKIDIPTTPTYIIKEEQDLEMFLKKVIK